MGDTKRPHLRAVLVPQVSRADPPPMGQLSLPLEPPTRVLLIDMTSVSQAELLSVLERESPSPLFDVRPMPNFDIGSLSRRVMFRAFRRLQIEYFDIAARIGIETEKDASISSGHVTAYLGLILASARIEPRTIGVLVEETQGRLWADRALHELITPRPRGGWRLETLPRRRISLAR